jgi:hypothetical protein
MDDDKDENKQRAGQIGGARRAEILPPNRRAEIARKAATTRWGGKPIRALHRGSFQEKFGIDVDCYVLDDAKRTPVISQRGMGAALGLSMRGNALPRFLAAKAIAEIAGAELREKLENPLKFQWGTGGAEQPPATIHGFDAGLLIDLCTALIDASAAGALSKRYDRIAKQARILVGASAKNGIRDLVYALSGYSPTAADVIEAFKLYVQEEARKYEPEFPPELYKEWYRLYKIPELERGKPWHFKYLTVNHVYYPLAQSSGKIFDLLKAHKTRGGNRAKKLFQFLNIIGARALGRHLGRVLEMAESSADKTEYETKIAKRFGFEQQLELPIPLPTDGMKEAAN